MFSLIGPKRYDAPWKDIESQGWIAPADCVEVRVTLPSAERMVYAVAEPEERYRLASCTHHKVDVVRRLVEQHPGAADAGDRAVPRAARRARRRPRRAADHRARRAVKERQRLFEAFRSGEVGLLVVSKVANFSIDLPTAEVAIQVSGSFGSRQEEAQRLGPAAPPEVRGQDRALLHDRQPRHRRRRLRRQPPAVPGRAGLRLLHPRRRGLRDLPCNAGLAPPKTPHSTHSVATAPPKWGPRCGHLGSTPWGPCANA